MTLITYCKSWFRAAKAPTEIWSLEQATAAYEAEEPYCVVVGTLEKPFCFIEANKRFFGVGFLDDHTRERLYYSYRELKVGQLFLGMATYREFIGGSDSVESGTTYIFQPTGSVKIQKQTFNPLTTSNIEQQTDVSGNYVSTPVFGHYDELIRVDR